MTVRRRRFTTVVLLAVALATVTAFVGAALGTEPAVAGPAADSPEPGDRLDGTSREARAVRDHLVPAAAPNAIADPLARRTVSDPSKRSLRSGRLSAPFAQADDDEEEHVIEITAPGDNVEYTLSAPGLEPTDDVEVGANAEDAANPEEIDGNTVSGTIGNGAYDTYRFTGPIERVRLESDDIDAIEVTIDGEPVDPRTLTGADTDTASTDTDTDTDSDSSTTGTADATTGDGTSARSSTPASGNESGTSGFGIVMYVLIGIVSGLVLAGALAYVVGTDRRE